MCIRDRSKDAKHGVVELDVVPPVPGNNLTPVTDAQVAANQVRLAYEDSIRGAYAALSLIHISGNGI